MLDLDFIIENPIYSILSAVGLLIFFLVLFRVGNFLESFDWAGGGKAKEKSKKEKVIKETKEKVSKTENKSTGESNVSKETDAKTANSTTAQNTNLDTSNVTNNNYLYDRYVDHPSKEDNFAYNSKINDAFLSDSEIDEIQRRKIKIRVKENEEKSNSAVYKKLQEMSSQDEKDREKLLDEFEHLPRTMKLLLIKNIMHNID